MLRGQHPKVGELRVIGAYSEGHVAVTKEEFAALPHHCGGGCGRRVIVSSKQKIMQNTIHGVIGMGS